MLHSDTFIYTVTVLTNTDTVVIMINCSVHVLVAKTPHVNKQQVKACTCYLAALKYKKYHSIAFLQVWL